MTAISFTLNGRPVTAEVEARTHLADLVREHFRLTATHLGCEHGVCGACTVLIDGMPARSCIALAVSLDGKDVRTLEGLRDDPSMRVLMEAFRQQHGLQCGFCTPGMLISLWDFLERAPDADEAAVRHALSGNLCRCTGYQGIVRAALAAAAQLSSTQQTDAES
ncbi:MAG: (2Fe-2S)-binding protein [Pseudomonadota bacterium]